MRNKFLKKKSFESPKKRTLTNLSISYGSLRILVDAVPPAIAIFINIVNIYVIYIANNRFSARTLL